MRLAVALLMGLALALLFRLSGPSKKSIASLETQIDESGGLTPYQALTLQRLAAEHCETRAVIVMISAVSVFYWALDGYL